MGKNMVMEHSLGLMDKSIRGNTKMESFMVKERSLLVKGNFKVKSMKGNGRMGNIMVKEHSLTLMEGSM